MLLVVGTLSPRLEDYNTILTHVTMECVILREALEGTIVSQY